MREIDSGYRKLILVCVNEREAGEAACGSRNSKEIHLRLKAIVKSKGLSRTIRVSRTRCLGKCEVGPTVAIFPENRWYGGVTLEDVEEILSRHLEPPE